MQINEKNVRDTKKLRESLTILFYPVSISIPRWFYEKFKIFKIYAKGNLKPTEANYIRTERTQSKGYYLPPPKMSHQHIFTEEFFQNPK